MTYDRRKADLYWQNTQQKARASVLKWASMIHLQTQINGLFVSFQNGEQLFIGAVGSWYWQGIVHIFSSNFF